MYQYLLKRLLWTIPTVLAAVTVTFVLMQMVPGGPFDVGDGMTHLPAAVKEQLERQYNLDKPVIVQYFAFLRQLLQGDLGTSFQSREGVGTMIARSFPTSVQLGAAALLISIVVGIPLGVLAATYRGSWIDHLCTVLSVGGFVLPSFVLGIFLIYILSLTLHWLPVSGWGTPAHLIMPALALGAGPAAQFARYTRSAMVEALQMDFVRVAHAKGLAPAVVVAKHALKNALLPVLTVAGAVLPNLLVGSFLVETMFSVPGTGRFFVSAINHRDYPVVMGVAIVYALMVATANLLTDILYAAVDPRIRYS